MNKKKYCLGIDTSNYTTSVAVVDEQLNIVCDSRKILKVKNGERGLRQSQALFEHISNMAEVVENLGFKERPDSLIAICASEKPRPVEDSYMPVFRAGESYGRVLAQIMSARYYGVSHQEGHVEAAKYSSGYNKFNKALEEKFLCFHLSGGTTEALLCRPDCDETAYSVEIIGRTLDISFGQLIDRIGVSLGLRFPCGKEMDMLALESDTKVDKTMFCKIKVNSGEVNLSGIETQVLRYIEETSDKELYDEKYNKYLQGIAEALFRRIGEALLQMVEQSRTRTGIIPVIMAGGVASSMYIRKMLSQDKDIYFGKSALSSDNAVGIAILGMKRYLRDETCQSFAIE